MLFNIVLYDGSTLEDIDGAVDATGITYQKPNSIIIPGEEDVMHMVMLPWAAISRLEYSITPEMIAAQSQQVNGVNTPHAELQPNRAQRRAAARD